MFRRFKLIASGLLTALAVMAPSTLYAKALGSWTELGAQIGDTYNGRYVARIVQDGKYIFVKIDGGNAPQDNSPIKVNGPLTIDFEKSYNINSSAGPFTLTINNIGHGEIKIANPNRTLTANNVTVEPPVGYTITQPDGTQGASPYVISKDTAFVHFWRTEQSTEIDVIYEEQTIPTDPYTGNGLYDASTNNPDITQAANQNSGSLNYFYAVSVQGTTNSGSTPSLSGVPDGTVLEVGDQLWFIGNNSWRRVPKAAIDSVASIGEVITGTDPTAKLYAPSVLNQDILGLIRNKTADSWDPLFTGYGINGVKWTTKSGKFYEAQLDSIPAGQNPLVDDGTYWIVVKKPSIAITEDPTPAQIGVEYIATYPVVESFTLPDYTNLKIGDRVELVNANGIRVDIAPASGQIINGLGPNASIQADYPNGRWICVYDGTDWSVTKPTLDHPSLSMLHQDPNNTVSMVDGQKIEFGTNLQTKYTTGTSITYDSSTSQWTLGQGKYKLRAELTSSSSTDIVKYHFYNVTGSSIIGTQGVSPGASSGSGGSNEAVGFVTVTTPIVLEMRANSNSDIAGSHLSVHQSIVFEQFSLVP